MHCVQRNDLCARQVLIFFNGCWSVFWFLAMLAIFIWKGVELPYPANRLAPVRCFLPIYGAADSYTLARQIYLAESYLERSSTLGTAWREQEVVLVFACLLVEAVRLFIGSKAPPARHTATKLSHCTNAYTPGPTIRLHRNSVLCGRRLTARALDR